MNTKYSFLFIILFVLFSCKKKSDAFEPPLPLLLPSTVFERTCTWDDAGKPTCLLTQDVISSDLTTFINSNLQEGKDLRTTNPALLTTQAVADIKITQPSDVFITFVFQGTGSFNAFAYYTFPTNQPPKSAVDIKKITYVFPNVKSNAPLLPGDKVKIGRFDVGTSIGFVLLKDAWNSATKKPDDDAVHFCTTSILNPEIDANLKKHAVLINYTPENKILIAYEDTDRTNINCDHDFNDVVFYATVR